MPIKTPELSDNPYDEETICHVTSTIVTPATIENVYLQNMDRLDMSYHQYQSQPILAPICRFEAHNDHIMNMLPEMNEMNDIGDDTVIGGIKGDDTVIGGIKGDDTVIGGKKGDDTVIGGIEGDDTVIRGKNSQLQPI